MKISKTTFTHLMAIEQLTPYITGDWMDFRQAGYIVSFTERKNLTCYMTRTDWNAMAPSRKSENE